MKYLFLFLSLGGLVFAYSQTEVDVANSLAGQGMIVDQSSNSSNYRLDADILRQEVIGIALKLKGINLPDNYICKKYFSDATKNDWVCRAAELAADNGIITKANRTVRPTEYITKSEALAIIMNADGIIYPKNVTSSNYSSSVAQWQIDVIEGAVSKGVLDTAEGFSYNKNALRKEVFQFLYNVLSLKGTISEPIKAQTNSEDSASIIEQHCQSDWPNDFSMKAYCIKQQQSGLADLGQGKPTDISESYFSTIRTKCKTDWPTDFNMRAYCEKQQYEAVRTLAVGKPSDITQKEFDIIRPKCERDWLTDFTMRVYCEKQQYEGVRELKK